MKLYRVGDKVISWERLESSIRRILTLRGQGKSQQEVARHIGVDRTFISRLETLGEIRKGRRIALLGFPIGNKDEIASIAEEHGVEFIFVMTHQEGMDFVGKKTTVALVDDIMYIVGQVQEHDIVILIGSDLYIRLAKALIDERELIPLELGAAPENADHYVNPKLIRDVLENVRVGD